LALLINDLRLRGDTKDATKYASEFGFGPGDLDLCMAATPRHYTADERAKILNLTYRDRQELGLRRTGSVDVDKAGRERARRDRYNAKRRASRAGALSLGVNKRSPVEGRLEGKKQEGEVASKAVGSITDRNDRLLKSGIIRVVSHMKEPKKSSAGRHGGNVVAERRGQPSISERQRSLPSSDGLSDLVSSLAIERAELWSREQQSHDRS
jgi:hypothetical protein